MIFGISSYTFSWAIGVPGNMPERPLTEMDLLQIADNNNLQVVQIADNLPLHLFDPDRITNLINKAKKLNISIEPGAKGMTPDNLHKYIEIAEALNSNILRFVIDDQDYQPEVNQVIEIIRNALPVLASKNITLALENHDRFTAREFEYIIEKCNSSRVGICLDSVNSLGASEDVKRITEVLAPYTVNFHVKEFIVARHSHKMGFTVTGCPLGKGMLPLTWILNKLNYNKCKTAILEQWAAPEDTLAQTINKENEWAIESIEYWKKYINV